MLNQGNVFKSKCISLHDFVDHVRQSEYDTKRKRHKVLFKEMHSGSVWFWLSDRDIVKILKNHDEPLRRLND